MSFMGNLHKLNYIFIKYKGKPGTITLYISATLAAKTSTDFYK